MAIGSDERTRVGYARTAGLGHETNGVALMDRFKQLSRVKRLIFPWQLPDIQIRNRVWRAGGFDIAPACPGFFRDEYPELVDDAEIAVRYRKCTFTRDRDRDHVQLSFSLFAGHKAGDFGLFRNRIFAKIPVNTLTYTIKIPHFEGPFDLLLFFIERDELDIYDIPIARITNDFLDYMKTMETLNIDMASEFILVAATLMRIKAKMLLPRKEVDEEGNEIDPRDELVNRLIEYKQYKEAMEDFRKMEARQHLTFPRGYTKVEVKEIAEKALVDAELESVTLYKLLNAFKRVMERYAEEKARVVHRIVRYNYTIQDQQRSVLDMLEEKKQVGFEDVFSRCENRIHAIITFLGILELLSLQKIALMAGTGINHFWLVEQEHGEEEE